MSDLTKNTVPDQSWLVLGPGRTGSMCIVTVLSTVLYEIYHNISYSGDIVNGPIPNGKIIHSHDLNSLNFVTPTTNVILSTRNPIESSLSHSIRQHTGVTHLFGRASITVQPFYLAPETFLYHYNSAINFYNNIPNEIKQQVTFIDYSEFCDNPLILCSLLGIFDPTSIENKKMHPRNCVILDYRLAKKLPKKNPNAYSEWISNWDEISNLCNGLKSNWSTGLDLN